jgi:phenylacetic acid degradation operon negative regulatory protein
MRTIVDDEAGSSWLGGLPEASGRSPLVTVLGELVLPARKPVRTASLLYVLQGMGANEAAARRSIARAADSGWITGEGPRREVHWWLTDPLITAVGDITRRAVSLTAPPQRWDRRCVIVYVRIPMSKRLARRPLHRQLRWIGFGNPMPGLWVSPHVDRVLEVQSLVRELDLQNGVVAFVGTLEDIGLTDTDIVHQGWDLERATAHYARLLDMFEKLQPRPGDEVLFAHLSLVHEWRELPYIDPQLPPELLPNWIGRHAADRFDTLYHAWVHPARERWAAITH